MLKTKPKYKKTVNKKWNSDQNWRYSFFDQNRKQIDEVLKEVDHVRSVMNVLYNEGYSTNMLNQGLTVDPDSAVVARNPTKNPGITSYHTLGNFGLDNLESKGLDTQKEVYIRLGIPKKKLILKKPFDNVQKVRGLDKMSLRQAAQAINTILNDGKKALINKYGESAHTFLRNNPGSEDRILYSYYKMPEKFKARLKANPNIKSFYNTYLYKGLNGAYKSADEAKPVLDLYFSKKRK